MLSSGTRAGERAAASRRRLPGTRRTPTSSAARWSRWRRPGCGCRGGETSRRWSPAGALTPPVSRYDEDAVKAEEKRQEAEEKKRDQEIKEWDDHLAGRGYKNRSEDTRAGTKDCEVTYLV